jgi:hypothetical protein
VLCVQGGCICGNKECTELALLTGATYHRIAASWLDDATLHRWCRMLNADPATIVGRRSSKGDEEEFDGQELRVCSHHFLPKYFQCVGCECTVCCHVDVAAVH